MKHILFVSHDASRTGAPVLLLHFLKWFKKNTTYPFVVLLRQDGVLREEFEKLAPVMVYQPRLKFKATFFNKFKSRFFTGNEKKDPVRHFLSQYDIGLIFSNTLTNGKVLQDIEYLQVPVISYIHELKYTLSVEYAGPYLDYSVKKTDFFLAGSKAVQNNLINSYQISSEKTKVIYSFLPPDFFTKSSPDFNKDAFKKSLGLDSDTLVVGGIGAGAWRKGIDLFILLAKVLLTNYPTTKYHFIWIGVGAQPNEQQMLAYDIEKAGLVNHIQLLPSTPEYSKYLQVFDVFVLSSREDPYPLVVLEAALLEKAIICFEGAGGTPEFVKEDAGIQVPYLDITGMATAIHKLQQNTEFRVQLGRVAKDRVSQMHDVEVAAPDVVSVIKNFL
ncbi:glycosyltransferase [Cytophagaceae bacterium YF14B1]|uniref:Glycosyltransferase n=1 Tax=Xanthocytophaga flava TaxID=3048013 RepID=A0AAE3QRG9_9BACT|nr:glycosyltransferase [Xanthocytophaga flavus]MDJ1482165.1 glycosyltransferase [Xanthocytophaga flavus]